MVRDIFFCCIFSSSERVCLIYSILIFNTLYTFSLLFSCFCFYIFQYFFRIGDVFSTFPLLISLPPSLYRSSDQFVSFRLHFFIWRNSWFRQLTVIFSPHLLFSLIESFVFSVLFLFHLFFTFFLSLSLFLLSFLTPVFKFSSFLIFFS